MIRRQLQRNGLWLIPIAGLMVAALASIGYILSQQNLSFPWDDRYAVRVEFASTTGLNPGLGQPVNVAGVRVGTVLRTRLQDGVSVAELEIDPHKLPTLYRDARAVLVPTTALKDIQIDISPGTPSAGRLPNGGTIDSARTDPAIDSDELTSILDADTRDLFRVLIAEADRGTDGRGPDLRQLFRALGPTTRQARQVTSVLAQRRAELERLVHNLAVLSTAVGRRDKELADLVEGSSATIGALAVEEHALGDSVERLPATLAAARRSLTNATPFALLTASTLTSLQPTVERLPRTLDAAAPLVHLAGPVIHRDLRPLVRTAQPLVSDLAAVTPRLRAITPHLISVVGVVTYLANELAFNPEGDDEGFLFWLAWALHNSNSVTSTQDAHGSTARSVIMYSCDEGARQPPVEQFIGIITGAVPACPGSPGVP